MRGSTHPKETRQQLLRVLHNLNTVRVAQYLELLTGLIIKNALQYSRLFPTRSYKYWQGSQ
jgi:hypothetical protein